MCRNLASNTGSPSACCCHCGALPLLLLVLQQVKYAKWPAMLTAPRSEGWSMPWLPARFCCFRAIASAGAGAAVEFAATVAATAG
jgi:hypothetical protein